MWNVANYVSHSFSFLFPVYLHSSPEVCYQRLLERGREEEKPVTLVSDGGRHTVCMCMYEVYPIAQEVCNYMYMAVLSAVF